MRLRDTNLLDTVPYEQQHRLRRTQVELLQEREGDRRAAGAVGLLTVPIEMQQLVEHEALEGQILCPRAPTKARVSKGTRSSALSSEHLDRL